MSSATGVPSTARLYETTVRHVRTSPLKHDFVHHSYSWFVDLDDLPRLGWLSPLARFEARDHLGSPDATLRENLDVFLATRGVDLRGGRITMLASARVLGYTFNPISVFWCYRSDVDADGELECVVVEVHNTYGERHAYLVRTDLSARASTDKALYVSPFNDVSGSYELLLPEPHDRAQVSVTLKRPGATPFVATLNGHARPMTRATVLRTALRHPFEPLVVTAKIRWHGIQLWMRRLPIQPRPTHRHQEAVR
ncbi:DUF1365 domain-containing protein [Lapillicoccus sp.]|uniref:DUF1365 domain-containing protein n=1 Tax=Lapillicoccus sp. TaxID=1909287 RepID=UPI003263CC07